MVKNNVLDCNRTSKDEDESRWLCFGISIAKSILITSILCLIGLPYIYYSQLSSAYLNKVFPENEDEFFTNDNYRNKPPVTAPPAPPASS